MECEAEELISGGGGLSLTEHVNERPFLSVSCPREEDTRLSRPRVFSFLPSVFVKSRQQLANVNSEATGTNCAENSQITTTSPTPAKSMADKALIWNQHP